MGVINIYLSTIIRAYILLLSLLLETSDYRGVSSSACFALLSGHFWPAASSPLVPKILADPPFTVEVTVKNSMAIKLITRSNKQGSTCILYKKSSKHSLLSSQFGTHCQEPRPCGTVSGWRIAYRALAASNNGISGSKARHALVTRVVFLSR